MSARELKEMVIKIFPRLERKMEGISETLNKERKYRKKPTRDEELNN